jgi:cullin 4
MKETANENSKAHEDVNRDRAYTIDAAIVRIMKARNVLSHSKLMAEVFGQVKFPTTGADVKKRLESLIEREYVERDADDPNMYKYLA